MVKDNSIYLVDIENACSKILTYTKSLTRNEFETSILVQDAVIRNISIIGEACNKFDKVFIKNHPEIAIKEAITMRNKLVHDYSFVDSSILWTTIK